MSIKEKRSYITDSGELIFDPDCRRTLEPKILSATFPGNLPKVPYHKGYATSVMGLGVTGGSHFCTFKQVYRADLTGF